MAEDIQTLQNIINSLQIDAKIQEEIATKIIENQSSLLISSSIFGIIFSVFVFFYFFARNLYVKNVKIEKDFNAFAVAYIPFMVILGFLIYVLTTGIYFEKDINTRETKDPNFIIIPSTILYKSSLISLIILSILTLFLIIVMLILTVKTNLKTIKYGGACLVSISAAVLIPVGVYVNQLIDEDDKYRDTLEIARIPRDQLLD